MNTNNSVEGIVVVHGIGHQQQLETVQRVMTRFARDMGHNFTIPIGDITNQIMPAGFDKGFQDGQNTGWAFFEHIPGYAFSEIHWADIAEKYAANVVPPLTSWAKSIPSQVSYIDKSRYKGSGLSNRQLDFATGIIDDTALSLMLMRFILGRYRIRTEELKEFMKYFVGSLLVFTEFSDIRNRIMDRFNKTLEVLSAKAEEKGIQRIHICSHSLGSVISLLGLVQADSDNQTSSQWLSKVSTLCTMGSPIDLFLPTWKTLWDEFEGKRIRSGLTDGTPRPMISWINFVDHGDPIASTLDIARDMASQRVPGLFRENDPIDYTYRTQSWPGGAHLAYWNDTKLFSTWIDLIHSHQPENKSLEGIDNPFVRRSKYRKKTNSFNLYVFLIPFFFAIVTGWQLVIWYEVNAGSTPLNRFFNLIFGMFISTQVFLNVVAGSSLAISKRPRSILLSSLSIFLLFLSCFITIIFEETFKISLTKGFVRDTIIWSTGIMIFTLIQFGLSLSLLKRHRKTKVFLLIIICICGSIFLPWRSDTLQEIVDDFIRLSFISITWWLTALWWRFFMVWTEYISGRQHIDWLRKRWLHHLLK